MTSQTNDIEHPGLITGFQNNRLRISLIGSGCSACHKSLCMLGDSKAKEVDVLIHENEFKTGDEVWVRINPASGHRAVLLLYITPFLLMLLTLISLLQASVSEGVSGLIALLILIPYFGLIYGLRKKFKSECKIDVVKK